MPADLGASFGASFGVFVASEEKSPNYKELERPRLLSTPFLEEVPLGFSTFL